MLDQKDFGTVYIAAYERWLETHMKSRRGESKLRLQNGLGHSEKKFVMKVWLPSFKNLDHLHPEYEVSDFKDGTRFLDFAYIRGGVRVCIEIDPYGTHGRDLDRWQHDDNLERQNDLMIDDWKMLRFSLDRIKQYPRQVQIKLHLALSKWGLVKSTIVVEDPIDQAIINLLTNRAAPLSPSEVARELGWSRSTISRHLHRLTKPEYVLPTKTGKRKVTEYTINLNHRDNSN